MSDKEIQQQMDAMRALDEPMPQVGIFWFDPIDHTFFGVRKQELTPKQVEEAADNGLPFINYPHLHRQVWAKEYFRAQAIGKIPSSREITHRFPMDVWHGTSTSLSSSLVSGPNQ